MFKSLPIHPFFRQQGVDGVVDGVVEEMDRLFQSTKYG
jgi:hypothetical protein